MRLCLCFLFFFIVLVVCVWFYSLGLFEFMQRLVLEEINTDRCISMDSHTDVAPQKQNGCRYELTA